MINQHNSERSEIILFTESFPYGEGEQFLETEIKYIASIFNKVTIVPYQIISNNNSRNVPDNVKIEKTFALMSNDKFSRNVIALFYSLTSICFYQEIISRPLSLLQLKALKRVLLYAGEGKRTYYWIIRYIENFNIDPAKTVIYTYWLHSQSLGSFFLKKKYPNIKFVSRTHRFDLYEEIQIPNYIPFRYLTLPSLDCLFCISDHGKEYLYSKYPTLNFHCEVSRLGVNDPNSVNPYSEESILRIVSCSFIVPVKRIHLIIEGIDFLRKLEPNIAIEWYHFGDGSLRPNIEKYARSQLPQSVKVFFKGQLENYKIIQFYKDTPIDVFLNVSESEGIPVSIMEAQSFGIPVVATSVGGTPEIVDNNNGILLPENPEPKIIAQSLQKFIGPSIEKQEKRKQSYKTWRNMYNAEVNYISFLSKIKKDKFD